MGRNSALLVPPTNSKSLGKHVAGTQTGRNFRPTLFYSGKVRSPCAYLTTLRVLTGTLRVPG
jgi:hypothetical protein